MLESSVSTQSSKRVLNSSSASKNSDGQSNNFADEESMISTHGMVGYRSAIVPRSVIIQRGSYNTSVSPGAINLKRGLSAYNLDNSSLMASSGNILSLMSSTGMNTVRQSSDKGKKDMQDLNERLACYIEKVRFLEAQNNKLIDELKRLKTKWGKETSQVKAMYQAELDEARKLLDEAVKEKSRFEIKVVSLEEYNEETFQRLDESNRQMAVLKEFVEKQNHQVSECEGELSGLRRRIDSLETDREQDKKVILSLQANINNARNDLDNETLLHIDAENRRQTLEEEISFLKSIHEQEMKELAALVYRDSTAENREYWKSEMGQALRDIQQIYDEKLTFMKGEIEIFYNRKMQDFKTGASRQSMEASHSKDESKRLRLQMNDLKDRFNDYETKNIQLVRDLEIMKRDAETQDKELFRENEDLKIERAKLKAEIDSMLFEIQSIVDAKLGLELEIAAYRKLLEVEEKRPTGSLKNIVDGMSEGGLTGDESVFSTIGSGFGPYFVNSNSVYSMTGAAGAGGSGSVDFGTGYSLGKTKQLVKGEMQAKTNYQKSAKGPLSVSECSPDGKYIVVDNTSRKAEILTGWKVVRLVDNNKMIEFSFKEGFSLDPNSKIKVWAKGFLPEGDTGNDLVCNDESWGVGANITTKLYNPIGEEKACHIQKTSYM